MATQQEIQELILKVQGAQELEELSAQLKAQEATLRELNEIVKQNAPLTQAQAAQQQRTAESMLATTAAIDQVVTAERQAAEAKKQAAKDAADAARMQQKAARDAARDAKQAAADQVKAARDAAKATKTASADQAQAAGKAGRAMLESGRIVQDFVQGGFGGILNNIEGFTRAVGGSAGLAGAATVVGVAFSLALPHIVEFMKSISPKQVDAFADALGTLKQQLKDIEERKVKIGVEATDIENIGKMVEKIEQGLAGFKQWEHEHTNFEQESGRQVGNILMASPESRAAREALLKEEQGTQQAQYSPLLEAQAKQAKIKAKFDRANELLGQATDEATATGLQAQIGDLDTQHQQATAAVIAQQTAAKKKAKANIGDLYKRAKEGDQDAQADLAQRLKAGGFQTLGHNITFASAEQVARNEEVKQVLEQNQESARAKAKNADAADRKHQEQVKAEDKRHGDQRKFIDAHDRLKQEYGPEAYTAAQQTLEQSPETRKPGETSTAALARVLAEHKQGTDAAKADAEKERDAATEHTRALQHQAAAALPGLGPEFVQDASAAQMRVNQMMPGRRQAEQQARLNRQIERQAAQRMIGMGTHDADEALPIAAQMPNAVREHVRQQQAAASVLGGNGQMPADISPQLQQLLLRQNGFIQGYQQQQAQMMGTMQQMGQMYGRAAAQQQMMMGNFRGVQGALQGNGFGGPFGGDNSF